MTDSDPFGSGSENADSSLHIVPSPPHKLTTLSPASPEKRPPSACQWGHPDPWKSSPNPSVAHGVPRVSPTTNLAPPLPLPRSSGSAYLRVTPPQQAQFASSWVSDAGRDAAPFSCAAFRFGWEPRFWFSSHCSKSGASGRGRRIAGHDPLVGIGGNCSQGSPPFPATASTTLASADLFPE